jgi:eukaryotic-like serine/threonine-protein kinase
MAKYSSYILYLLITILVVILYVNDFGPMQGLQQSVNDFLCRVTAGEDVRPNITIVSIDDRSMKQYGKWPWHHDLIADLMAAAAGAHPKALVMDAELLEDAREDSAGYTDVLAGQLTWMENVVLPYDIALATFRSDKTSNPKYLYSNSISIDNKLGMAAEDGALNVRKVFLPAEKLLQDKVTLGFDYVAPDDDRTLRHQAMVMNFEGFCYPSLPLLGAATYLGVPPDQIKLYEGKSIQLGNQRTVPIDERGEYFVKFSKGQPFLKYSASDVLADGFNLDILKGKLVLIGVDDPEVNESFATPVTGRTSELLVKASTMENIINDNMLSVQHGTNTLAMIILFALGGICAFILPRVTLLFRTIVLAGSLLVLANINYFMVSSFHTLPQLVFFALQIVLFMAASPLLDTNILAAASVGTVDHKKSAKTKSSRQSELEVPVRELNATSGFDASQQKTAVLDANEQHPYDYQTINLESESQETGATSQSPDSDSSGDFGSSPDSSSLQQALSDSAKLLQDANRNVTHDSGGIMGGDELKKLGRYQVTGVLGKGAMGTVYKGIDPAINRPVALKTIRLDFVNDPAEFEELKERLYREAQAAGKLSHPNIVTIYDVGSEGSLQYIAMEYLEGQTLENLIKKKAKFSYKIIAQMITQICSALDYAHERGIVHRDIKPANVMVLADYRVKVMDFGIARIDSNSMTKTGIAMGTPNYISPEQLKGLTIDRRADLFSLGVMMYEMLLGRRPFKGENITSLIYSILHHDPQKPSEVNPQIPLLFDQIIMKALKKPPQDRYQKASDIASDLHDFVESFTNR